jgi:acetylornithine aminotransferase
MRLNPLISELGTYPFARLDDAKAAAVAAGADLIDFGVGEPREETPEFLRAALRDSITPLAPYPKAVGLPELRQAIAAWAKRRTGAVLDPNTQIVPTLGAKEAVFHLPQLLEGDAVATTSPGYPVGGRGARFAGKRSVTLPLRPQNGWLPDLADLTPELMRSLALLWINTPNNPTGAVAPLSLLEQVAERCRQFDVVLGCDEAYSELWFSGGPPASALQLEDLTNVCVVNTLSKRSAMAAYRSGFIAGDRQLISALKTYRPSVGVAPLEHVQRAAIAAWQDEQHVDELRARYRAKWTVLRPALLEHGFLDVGGPGSFFLWLKTPNDELAEACAERLLTEHGIVVAPGTFFGPEGSGHVRVALVPTLERCAEAAARLSS